MKLALRQRRELTSATLTQTLGLMAGCSALLILTAYASDPTAWADPAWWSAPGPNGLSAVMPEQVVTNAITGLVTTNYIADNSAAVTQGQLKKFTVRAVDELNSGLSAGAGSDLSAMVSNWAQDYATNGYNATNPKPADSTAMTVGQLKYVGNKVWAQLVAGGYTSAAPSWLAQNTATDNELANIAQLKEIFNFSLNVTPPAAPANLTVTASNPGELDLTWTNNASNATSITINVSTDGGVTWTKVTTLTDPSINSYAVTGLSSGSNYQFQITASNTAGPSPTTTNPSPPSPPIPRYAVIDFGTNFYPAGINNSNIVVGNAGITYYDYNTYQTASIWNWASNTNQPLQASSSLVSGITNYTAFGIDDSGHIVGNVINVYSLELGSRAACYWASSTQAPVILGQADEGVPTYEQNEHSEIFPGFWESSVGGISDQGYIVGRGVLTPTIALAYNFSPSFMELGMNVGHQVGLTTIGNDALSYGVSGAAGASSWCGNCTLYNTNDNPAANDGTYPVINGTVYASMAYSNITLAAINDSNITAGYAYTNANSSFAADMISPGSGNALAITYLGPGSALYLNNQLATNGTPTPQIIGYDTNSIPMLWDKTTYAATAYTNAATGNYLGKTLSLLLPGTTNSPWTMTGISGINNAGSIIGSATYSGTNTAIPAGAHGVELLPLKVSWVTIGSNTPIDDNDDPVSGQPMPGGGKRIYPDKQNPNDTGTGRNKVTLRVDTNGAGAGLTVYVKAFDVADPTPDSGHVIHPHGTATGDSVGGDNFTDPESTPLTGSFTSHDITVDTAHATLDSTGKADFEFNVGYQPGNNYRVAVTFFKPDALSALQVADNTQSSYVPMDASKSVADFNVTLSPPLTVWRRLWIEQDSMVAVPTSGSQADFIQGNVTAITRNSPASGQSTISTDTAFQDDANRFENGVMTINGVDYPVISNTDNGSTTGADSVVITGTPADAAVVDKSFKLVDDDEYGLPSGWSPLMPRFSLVTSEVISKYSPSYILVVDASTYNTNQTVPFVLNEDLSSYYSFYSNYNDVRQSIDLSTSAQCWEHLVVAAYQPGNSVDDDPNSESPLSGSTASPDLLQTFSVVFLEVIRDRDDFDLRSPNAGTRSLAQADFIDAVSRVTAHEIGHSPGNQTEGQDHAEGGLMGEGATLGPTFLAPTILRFRKSQTWNED